MEKESPAGDRWENLAPDHKPRHGSCSTHSCWSTQTLDCSSHWRHSSVLQYVTSHKNRTCFSPVSCKTFCGSTGLISLPGTWAQARPCHTHWVKGLKCFFQLNFPESIGSISTNPHVLADFFSSANNQEYSWWAFPFPGTQPRSLPADPWVISDTLCTLPFRISLLLTCCPCPAALACPIPQTVTLELQPCFPPEPVCPQLQFLSFIPLMGLGHHQYPNTVLTASKLRFPPLPENHFPLQRLRQDRKRS